MVAIIYIITFFIGLLGAALNTLPPSATNLVIVKYTSEKNLKKALHLAYGASLGELLVAGLALGFGVLATNFFEKHIWVQIIFIILIAIAGVYFIASKVKKDKNSNSSTIPQRFINGLLLGALNIPMFIYWTAVFSLASRFVILDKNSPWILIILFLVGVFLGKFAILYLYGKLSNYMSSNFSSFKGKLNKIIGIVLLIAAVSQSIKLFIS